MNCQYHVEIGKCLHGSIPYLPLTLSLTGTAETFDFGLGFSISTAQIRQQQTEIAYQHQPTLVNNSQGFFTVGNRKWESPRPDVIHIKCGLHVPRTVPRLVSILPRFIPPPSMGHRHQGGGQGL